MSFAKNIGKNLIGRYSQKLLDSAKTSTTNAIRDASKRVIQKNNRNTGDLIGNKSANKRTVFQKIIHKMQLKVK